MSATTDKDTGAAARPRLLLGQSIAKNLIVGEKGSGGFVGALVHFSYLPPPCRRQPSPPYPLVCGCLAQSDETLLLEGLD